MVTLMLLSLRGLLTKDNKVAGSLCIPASFQLLAQALAIYLLAQVTQVAQARYCLTLVLATLVFPLSSSVK